jgi:hypothetical protein
MGRMKDRYCIESMDFHLHHHLDPNVLHLQSLPAQVPIHEALLALRAFQTLFPTQIISTPLIMLQPQRHQVTSRSARL